METFWLAEDEDGLESVHQHEPSYNRLHSKWMGNTKVYVGKGLINRTVEFKKESIVKAYAIELEPCNKISNIKIIRVVKIY